MCILGQFEKSKMAANMASYISKELNSPVQLLKAKKKLIVQINDKSMKIGFYGNLSMLVSKRSGPSWILPMRAAIYNPKLPTLFNYI